MNELKSGYTTGTCAAACVKGALHNLLEDRDSKAVYLETLNGKVLRIRTEKMRKRGNFCTVSVKKEAGDDPDVTDGIEVFAKVKIVKELKKIEKGYYLNNILVYGGRGVGISTKKGLQCPVGKSAINPGPLKMIENAVKDVLEERNLKVEIMIYIPEGREKAKKTFNEKLGVMGGLSILGSTGILNPMSSEALKKALYAQMKVVKEDKGSDWIIFSFGSHGRKYCEELEIDRDRVVVMSNYVGFVMESAAELGFKRIVLIGHIGKAVKIAGGIYDTHSRVADCRMEIMGANAFLAGEKPENIFKILNSNTVEEACEYVTEKKLFTMLADKAAQKCVDYTRDSSIRCEALLFSFSGKELGHSKGFYELMKEMHEESTQILFN